MRRLYEYKNVKGKKASTNFNYEEWIAKSSPLRNMYEKGTYTKFYMSVEALNMVQKARTHFGKSAIITSGYRPEEYNKSVDGATSSYHIVGGAADFYINGVSCRELARYMKSIGCKGIGLYDNFVHIDDRTTEYFWTCFGGNTKRVYSF